MSRFVRPDKCTLTLANGDTLIVKRRLNWGEQRKLYQRVYRETKDGDLKVDPWESGLAMVVAFLIDWSLTDDDGHKIDIAGLSIPDLESCLDLLAPDDFTEIKNAVQAHNDAQNEARAQEKKVHGGVNNAAVISPSPSAAAGGSSGSVN